MAVHIQRAYFTLAEVGDRWRLPAGSLDLRRAILTGVLRPSIFVTADLVPLRVQGGGHVIAGDGENVHGLCFLQGLQQTGVFDCVAPAVSRARDLQEDDTLYLLDAPLSMADILAQGVVMAEDLAAAEQHLVSDDFSTKEVQSMLKLLAITLVDGYGVQPGGRSSAPAEICDAGTRWGLPISENTVRKLVRQAFDQYPPHVQA